MASREFWEEQFEVGASRPSSWQFAARNLIATANLARRAIEERDRKERERWNAKRNGTIVEWGPMVPMRHVPTMMLYAFAVENLAKAILIACGTKATDGLRLARELKTHDLIGLVKSTGLQLDNDSGELLHRMGRFIFSGRYPVQTGPHPGPYADSIAIPQDFAQALAILQRLDDALRIAAPGQVDDACDLAEL